MSDTTGPSLFLVDGTAQLFRAYFAIRGLTRPDGLPTNAVFGFTAMLRKLIQQHRPTHLAVIFDPPGPVFRHEQFSEYKANRPPTPEEFNVQVPFAKQVCRVLGVHVEERAGFEADDVIATYARKAHESGFRVVVVASDKDLLQVVGDGIVVLDPNKDRELDEARVEESFGVPPDRVRDVLGLMGDSVDNIPGVPGVGRKTAVAAVATYGELDRLVERAGRFVAVFEARDRLADAIAGAAKLLHLDPAAAAGLVDEARCAEVALEALLEREPEGMFRERCLSLKALMAQSGVAEPGELAGLQGRALGRRLAALKRGLKGLDRGSSRRGWFAIHEHRELARRSRELATLDDHVPVELRPEQLELGEPDRTQAHAIFADLGFRALTDEFSMAGFAEESGDDRERPSARYEAVVDPADLDALVTACRKAGRFALDTETDSTDPMQARLVGLSLAWRPHEGFYLPVGHQDPEVPRQLGLELLRERLGPLLADSLVAKVGQNLKYDAHVLRRHGLPVEGWALDTMVAAFLLDSGRSGYGMDGLAREFLGHETIKYEDVAGAGAAQVTLDRVPVARVTAYAAEDAEVTLRLAELFDQRLEEAGLSRLYREIDGPLLPLLTRMEAWGIRIDVDRLGAMSVRMDREMERVRGQIHRLAGVEFNVDSPKQLREVLFERLGLRPRRRTAKSRAASTDAQTLEELAAEHEIATRVLEYRELAKLKGTYVDTLPRLVNPETGRVHTCYHPTGAATGRLSSSDPNLQNIPARTEAGREIREAFVPDDGFVFLASDYSQVELRVLAHLCEDPELIAAFRAGEDIHRHTAARVFGVVPDLVTDSMRRRAKAINFGILYGMSETRLAREQGMSRADARRFIQTYFERFAGIRAYIDGVREQARRDASVTTLFGRVRRFPLLHERVHRGVQEQALRGAVNTTIQGTAADLMKLAMLAVERALTRAGLDARILLQVHDELLLEVPVGQLETTAGRVRQAMEGVHPLAVPLVVDQKTGNSWNEVT